MLRLTEAVLRFLKTAESSDPQARMEVEAQLRSINELIAKSGGEAATTQPSLMDGSVISVKEEWSLVVGNIGEKQGVKMGMPLRVMRGDKLDRDAASGGCAPENLRRGDSRNGF